MEVTAIVFSCILYALSLVLLGWRQIASPCCSFLGLLIMSLAKTSDGYPLFPINSSMIFGWLCVTVLVTVVTLLQPRSVRDTSRGVWYMTGGAIVGLAIGLLGFTVSSAVGAMYAIMIICVAVGTFFGYLLYTGTPGGKGVALSSGHFFNYFLAKGFPVAVTIMQGGVVLVLVIAINSLVNYVQ